VDDEYSGTVVEKMALRKGEMTDMRPSGGGKTRITFSAPSRGLIGYHGEFLSDTRGTGIMNRLFEKYGPYKGSDRRPQERRADLQRIGRGGGLCAWPRWKNAASCSSASARRSTKA
jgi:GTP-binding protein